MTFDPIADLVRDEGFRTGLALGLLGAAVVGAAALVRRQVFPLAGAVVVLATVFGLAAVTSVPTALVIGLALLATGSAVTEARPFSARFVAVLPGAIILALAVDVPDVRWAGALVLLTTLVGGTVATDFDRAYATTGLGPVVLAVTALGVFATAPDTDQAAVLVGATLPVALLGWPWPLASLGAAATVPAIGLVAWMSAVEGQGRPGAIIGAIGCLGILVAEPAVRFTLRSRARTAGAWRVVLLAVIHGGMVLVCSRVAGLRDSATSALQLVGVTYAVGGFALALALLAPGRSRTRPRRD